MYDKEYPSNESDRESRIEKNIDTRETYKAQNHCPRWSEYNQNRNELEYISENIAD